MPIKNGKWSLTSVEEDTLISYIKWYQNNMSDEDKRDWLFVMIWFYSWAYSARTGTKQTIFLTPDQKKEMDAYIHGEVID